MFLQRVISFLSGTTLGAVIGDSFRLTPGVLTILSLAAGFGTAVVVAVINTRHERGDREVVSLPLERWAAERLQMLEAEVERLRKENGKLWDQNQELHARLIEKDATSGS